MARMALPAIDGAMLAQGSGPLGVDRLVTGRTGLHVGVSAQGDLHRLVDILMARGALLEGLSLVMPLVALEAIRDVAMRIMVTGITPLLRVGAGERGQLFCRAGMTIGADGRQLLDRRSTLRRMRVAVAIGAGRLLRTMRLAMTGAALRHQLSIIVQERAVAVELFVTFLTGKPMSAAGIFQVGIVNDVALPALNGLQ